MAAVFSRAGVTTAIADLAGHPTTTLEHLLLARRW
jgi:hypothetical protein